MGCPHTSFDTLETSDMDEDRFIGPYGQQPRLYTGRYQRMLGDGTTHLQPGSDTPTRVKTFQLRPRQAMHMGPTMLFSHEQEKHAKTCTKGDQPCKLLKAYHEKEFQKELR